MLSEAMELANRVALSDGTPELRRKVQWLVERSTLHQDIHLFTSTGGGHLPGALLLSPSEGPDGYSAELFVDVPFRRQGIGTELIAKAKSSQDIESFRLWNHGHTLSGAAFAVAQGFSIYQQLVIMEIDIGNTVHSPLTHAATSAMNGYQLVPLNRLVAGSNWKNVLNTAYRKNSDYGEIISRSSWFDPELCLLALDINDQMTLGLIIGRRASRDGVPAVEIHAMAVDPKFRGRGVASALVSGAVSRWLSEKSRRVFSYVDKSNAAAASAYVRAHLKPVSDELVYRT